MKILYITTIGVTMNFFKSFIKELLDEGHTVDIAANISNSKIPDCYTEWGCRVYPLSCSRSPLDVSNLMAVNEIKQLVSGNKYDIVHCHTPVAAMCTRLACRKARKQGTRVFYTAHGFHFYKGAPLKNWLLFYPVEKMCAHLTDVLITINKEDYERAKKKLKAKKIAYVPGVGIDLDKFARNSVETSSIREELNIPKDATLLLSVGELNENKNHQVVINAMAKLNNPNIYYMIAGRGNHEERLKKLAETLGLKNRVFLLGYRNDVNKLYAETDIFVFPSFREGLSVSVMEAMASGLPVTCSHIRGNIDLIDENGGVLFDPFNVSDCEAAIKKMMSADLQQMGAYNLEKINQFSLNSINIQMSDIIRGTITSK